MAHGDEEDPARRFLDQTVPRDDVWDGREPEEGPARPRHVQYPTEPDSMRTAKERRKDAIRNAAWTFGPGVAYVAGAAALSGLASAEPRPEAEAGQEPEPDVGGVGEIGSGF